MSTKSTLSGDSAFTISYSPEDLVGIHQNGKVVPKILNARIRDKMIGAILMYRHGVDEKELDDALLNFRLRFMRKFPPQGSRLRPLIVMRYQYEKSRRVHTVRLQFESRNGMSTLTGRFIT